MREFLRLKPRGDVSLRTPPRILAVDDVPTNLEILRVRLEAQGYEVVTAADGEEALARARELEPDLVLLDIMMPKLDGISVLKQLKQDAALRFVPVILVTAKADTATSSSGSRRAATTISPSRSSRPRWSRACARCCASRSCTTRSRSRPSKLKEQTEQLSSWNRLLEERVATQIGGNRTDRPPAAIPGAAGGAR